LSKPKINGRRGALVVVSGPSGVGKTVLARRVAAAMEGVGVVLTATTRKPRSGEADGRDYRFVPRETFREWADAGMLLEHAVYAGEFYGTPLDCVEQTLAGNDIALLLIDVQGAAQIRQKLPESVSVFIAPPSEEALMERLIGRGKETEEQIRERLKRARREMALKDSYDYILVNDDLEETANDFKSLLETIRLQERT